ncbi:MAG: hypothetical protein HYY23_06130 [Verrucomicrobia bacterium]|nr:hypothetical protein [Verrucomicrobiota bacterium]
MVIKVNGAGATALAVDREKDSGVEDPEFSPLAEKIVMLDVSPEQMSATSARSDSLTPRFRLEERLESLLARSLNLVISKAVERKAREYSAPANANIIESGLSRRPSEFPEAA